MNKDLPFFAWQCLTFQTDTRSTDLVIKDDENIFLVIMFLIY